MIGGVRFIDRALDQIQCLLRKSRGNDHRPVFKKPGFTDENDEQPVTVNRHEFNVADWDGLEVRREDKPGVSRQGT